MFIILKSFYDVAFPRYLKLVDVGAHFVFIVDESDWHFDDKIVFCGIFLLVKVFALEDADHQMALPGSPDARPAWKERYTYEQITARIQEVGYRNSMRQYFHKHIEDGNIFKPEHIVWAKPEPLDKYESLITYVDPSFKDTKKNDFKAIVLIGRVGRYYDILWAWIRQDTKSNMVKAHYDAHERIEEGVVPLMHYEEGFSLRQV
ncbi:MAG: hypothetical protein M3Q97_02135, partial [Bacteroidota bacterium]|nr:hypothetical protein [Bacteroidota bacterium]